MNEALLLFVEKAHRLETSSFWGWATSRRGAPDMEGIIGGDWLAHDKFDHDSLDAFCMNLRLLVQDRDGFSVRQIREIAKEWPEPYKPLRDNIENAAVDLQRKLAMKSLVQVREGQDTTNKELFDIVFYGGIVHANPDKRTLFKEITTAGLFSYFVVQAFLETLFHYRNCIQTTAYNVAEYLRLNSKNSIPISTL